MHKFPAKQFTYPNFQEMKVNIVGNQKGKVEVGLGLCWDEVGSG